MVTIGILDDLFKEDYKSKEEIAKDSVTTKEKCKTSLKLFCETYLSHWFYAPFCEFHLEIIEMLEDLTFAKTKRKMYKAVASPRNHAKTTIVSKAYSLWLIAYKHEDNMVLIADTVGQSCEYLDDIKNEIESNELYIADFGLLQGRKLWRNNQITTANDVTLTCKGTGSKIRGMAKRGRRPGIYICDELENDEYVENSKIRAKLRSWLNKVVIPSSCETGKFFIIGTILHEDSLLNNLLHNKQFNYWGRHFFQAVQAFSESPLWDQWQAILESDDIADDDKEATAYAFYQENRDVMLYGVKALWMEKSPDYFYDMMVLKWSDPDAFSSEMQNIAISPENQIFTSELLDNATFDNEPPSPIKEIYIGVDPSLGKTSKSDLSSIAAVARCENDVLYVIDIDAKRRKPDILIEDTFNMVIKYRAKLAMVKVENNGLLYLFYDQFIEAASKRGLSFPYDGVKTEQNKEIKIQSMAPKMKQGKLKINSKLRGLRNEFLAFPRGTTDDQMDSVTIAMDGLMTASVFSFTSLSGNQGSTHRHSSVFGNLLKARR